MSCERCCPREDIASWSNEWPEKGSSAPIWIFAVAASGLNHEVRQSAAGLQGARFSSASAGIAPASPARWKAS